MTLRKRISAARERNAQARAKRREQSRRAERAKQAATASERSEARSERRSGTATEKAKASPERKPTRPSGAGSGSKRRQAVTTEARKLGGGVTSVVTEVLKLGREMLVIPTELWLGAAEIAGAFVLKVWMRGLRPLLIGLWKFARAAVRLAERYVTPARAVVAVSLVAVGALAASQWLDYHSVTVGTDAYAGAVGAVAPAPEVESEIAGNAHGWVMVPLAVAALVVLTIALSGRRRAAVLLVPIGIAVIVIALVIDVPKGLDEGSAAVTYEGASANLLEGFWVQIAAAVVLIACGLLLPRYLRPVSAKALSASEPTGPTLFEKLAETVRKRARRPTTRKRRLSRPRLKRKVQGAGT
jgi:hypothetical protein